METTTSAMRSNAAIDRPTTIASLCQSTASTHDDDDGDAVVEMMTNNNKNKTRKTFAIVVLARLCGLYRFFYRAMLCIRGTSHGPVSVCPSVSLSVRPTQVGVLLKRLNIGSHKQHHTIAQGL